MEAGPSERRDHDARGRLAPKPAFVDRLEARIGSAIPLHPNAISAAKLVLATPLMVLGLRQVGVLNLGRGWILAAFVAFAVFDYLDGVVARARGLDTQFGRLFDRFTDYPLLAVVAWACLDVVSVEALAAKLALDATLLLLYALGKGSTENRIRTGISYAALGGLMVLSQGWAPRLVTAELVVALVWTNVGFSSLVVLNNLGVLQKRFIADALSAANLACGGVSIYFAWRGRVDLSILFLLLGAAFDGFDGAAARRWGGTRWGVYSDDVADGVNYGIAPGLAIGFVVGGVSGWVLGGLYSVFTISRLVFFTVNKSNSDPEYFAGVPSTVGGLVTLCALALFAHDELVLGALVGAACVLMVSFDTQHRHLGRALGGLWSRRSRALYLAPAWALALVVGGVAFGMEVPITALLVAGLAYGLWPIAIAFRRARQADSSSPDPASSG